MGELSNPQLLKRCRHRLDQVMRPHQLLEPGEAVIVGVSGGPDSLTLLHLLDDCNRRRKRGWRIVAVHVDLGFAGWNSARIERIFRRMSTDGQAFRYEILKADVTERIARYRQNACHVCSFERRRLLFDLAGRLGIRKIAYAHHLEDVNETYLMNLLFAASGSAFVPKQDFFDGALQVIRPLYNFDKPLILRYLKLAGIRPVRNRCPQETTGKRALVRRFLGRLYAQDPRIRNNLFAGIRNIKREYLPE